MKYSTELSNLESEIIRLDTMKSLTRLIAEGSPNCRPEDTVDALWHISEMIEDINEKASQHFQNLWDQVREDSLVSKTEYKKPSKASTELNDIVNNWIISN
jgi:hypothetical protein